MHKPRIPLHSPRPSREEPSRAGQSIQVTAAARIYISTADTHARLTSPILVSAKKIILASIGIGIGISIGIPSGVHIHQHIVPAVLHAPLASRPAR